MNKKCFVIDIDSVICNIENPIIDYINNEWNVNITYYDMKCFEFDRNPLLSSVVAKYLSNKIKEGKFLYDCLPYNGSVESLTMLNEYFDIMLVTGRYADSSKNETIEWLDKYKIPYNSLYFTDGIRKEGVVSELNAVGFVEDNFDTITMVLRKCGPLEYGIYCVEHPWNEKYFNKYVHKVEKLGYAIDMVLNKL